MLFYNLFCNLADEGLPVGGRNRRAVCNFLTTNLLAFYNQGSREVLTFVHALPHT